MKIVGAAVIYDKEGRVLIGKRPEGKDLAGLWEFPGGKQEDGETIEQCLARELKEELNICCEVGRFLLSASKSYPHGEFKLMFYEVSVRDLQNLKAFVHQELKWVKKNELKNYAFPPADVEIIEYLSKDLEK